MSRLTVVRREGLIRRYLEEHGPFRTLAAHAGISQRKAFKWLARYRVGGTAALTDRRSPSPWWVGIPVKKPEDKIPHVDTKQLGYFQRMSHRITRDPQARVLSGSWLREGSLRRG